MRTDKLEGRPFVSGFGFAYGNICWFARHDPRGWYAQLGLQICVIRLGFAISSKGHFCNYSGVNTLYGMAKMLAFESQHYADLSIWRLMKMAWARDARRFMTEQGLRDAKPRR